MAAVLSALQHTALGGGLTAGGVTADHTASQTLTALRAARQVPDVSRLEDGETGRHTHTHTHTRTGTHTDTHTETHTHRDTRTHTQRHARTDTHTRIHTHIHTTSI